MMARAIVDQVLGELERLDPGEEKPFDAAEICALGLRIEADCADLARAARTAAASSRPADGPSPSWPPFEP